MNRPLIALFAALALGAAPARASDPDVTGLVPTIWWDFETQPDAGGLANANKGSAGTSFSHEGTKTYKQGVGSDGWALDTSRFTPYSGAGSFSTAGNAFTVSLVMTLGSKENGITLNVRTTAGDVIVRRGSTEGSLVVGFGAQQAAQTQFLGATFADGDAAWHLVSVVGSPEGTALYVDGELADSSAAFTPWSASGKATQMQFGSHLNGTRTGEAKNGGLVDDLRIHDAALTPLQIRAIAAEYGLARLDGYVAVRASGETAAGKDSFRTPFDLILGEGDAAEAAIVYGMDPALSAPATNLVGSALPAGGYEASLSGLAPDTAYWWKIVASNGVNRAETPVATFRTLAVVVPTDFARRIPVAVSGYAGTETLTNFPVLVRLAADSPAGFDYADCAEDGADLRFAGADGAVAPHEIERWDANGTSYVWVRVPRLPPAGAALSLYYGADPAGLPAVDPADVWTRYAAVVHGGSGISDSSPSALAVANGGGVEATSGSGVAAGGLHKAARNSKGVNIPNPVLGRALSSASRFTLTTWYRTAGTGTSCMSASKSSFGGTGFLLLCEGGTYMSVAVGGHQGAPGKGALVEGRWAHVAFSYDTSGAAGSLRTYFDGENIYSNDAARAPTDGGATYWTVGSYADAGSNDSFVGDMDEIRLFDGIASADWIKAEYDSVSDPASFVSLSPAEATDADRPRFGELSSSDENGTATFSVALAVPGFGGAVPTAVSVFYGTDGVAADQNGYVWLWLPESAESYRFIADGSLRRVAAGGGAVIAETLPDPKVESASFAAAEDGALEVKLRVSSPVEAEALAPAYATDLSALSSGGGERLDPESVEQVGEDEYELAFRLPSSAESGFLVIRAK